MEMVVALVSLALLGAALLCLAVISLAVAVGNAFRWAGRAASNNLSWPRPRHLTRAGR